jgi:hypothetical protein
LNDLFKKLTDKNFYMEDEIFLFFRNEKEEIIKIQISLFNINKNFNVKWFLKLKEIIEDDFIVYNKNFSLINKDIKSKEKIEKEIYHNYNILKKEIFDIENIYSDIILNKEILLNQNKIIMLKTLCLFRELEILKKNENNLYFYFSFFGLHHDEITNDRKIVYTNKLENGNVYLWNEESNKHLITGEFFFYLGEDRECDDDIYFNVGKILSIDDETSDVLDVCKEKLKKYKDFYGIKLKNNYRIYNYKTDDLLYINKLYSV